MLCTTAFNTGSTTRTDNLKCLPLAQNSYDRLPTVVGFTQHLTENAGLFLGTIHLTEI